MSTIFRHLSVVFGRALHARHRTWYMILFGALALSLYTLALVPTASAVSSAPVFLMKWGGTAASSDDGQFNNPRGITLDNQGNVYVADSSNQRIQKFDNFGNFIKKWGTPGTGDGQFNEPRGIAVADNGDLYVVDSSNHRVQVFDSEGNFLRKWGSLGSGNNQFNFPRGVCLDASDNVYVVDWNNNRVAEFDSTGTFIRKWGTSGSGNGQFSAPHGCVIDSANDMYVVEQENYRVQKFDLDTTPPTFLLKWGTQGTANGQFDKPHGIMLDSGNHIQVADTLNHRIQEFTTSGTFVRKWGSSGTDNGKFNEPRMVAEDANGNFFVADTKNHRVQKFGIKYDTSVCNATHLINAIYVANNTAGADSLELDGNCTYTLLQPVAFDEINNKGFGLPLITTDITMHGNGATIERSTGAADFGIFHLTSTGTLNLQRLTLQNGRAQYTGGAVHNYGALTITDSTLANNYAPDAGGAVFNGGTVLIDRSTLRNNDSPKGSAVFLWGGGPTDKTALLIVNSTLTDNTNANAIRSDDNQQIEIINSTIVRNNVGIYGWVSTATFTITNSIIANNTSQNCSGGTKVDGGNNIENGTSCGFSAANNSQPNTDPLLDSDGLKDNGGPTQTIALQNGSPAIDAGNYTVCAAAPVNGVDQRGVVRPQSAHCDIGAFEKTPFTLTVIGAGDGSGTVSASGISCSITNGTASGDCTEPVMGGNTVTLNQSPAADSVFDAWGGDCDANGQVTMTSDKTCSANFNSVDNPIVVGCNVTELVAAIDLANIHAGADTLSLDGTCTYTLTTVNNNVPATSGANGLPPLTGETTINANGATITRDTSAPTFRILYVSNTGTLSLNDATISNGVGDVVGGGIAGFGTLVVNRSTIANNSASWSGGGIQSSNSTLIDVTLSSNSAPYGGGVFAGSDGTAHLERVTFVNNNRALSNDWRGVVTVGNSTFVGTSELAIYNIQDGTITLANVTLSGNGEGIANFSGTVVAKNSILANGCTSVTDGGNNINSNGTCSVGTVADPMLDPAGLQDNGGHTQTIALQAGSPAINAGNNGVCNADPVNGVDQRGITRPQGADCDIGAYELVIAPIDDKDTAIQYNGWEGEDNANASGGTYRESNTQNDTITFKFTGKAVTWISHKGPDMGKAQVMIDGVDKGTIDLYSASEQWQFAKNYKKLSDTKHKLVIKVLGSKNANASDTKVGLDAFKVGTVVTEDTASTIHFNGWSSKNNAAASGGSYRISKNKNARVEYTFDSTQITWLTAKGPKYGKARVLIDGADQGVFDLYAATAQWQAPIPFSGLAAGQHTIEIQVLGKKNAASTGNAVVVDAFQ